MTVKVTGADGRKSVYHNVSAVLVREDGATMVRMVKPRRESVVLEACDRVKVML